MVKDRRWELPIKNAPTMIDEPTYKAINDMMEALYVNANSIPATLGGGAMAKSDYSWMQ